MARAKAKVATAATLPEPDGYRIARGLREGALLALLAIAAYVALALLSYDPADQGWSRTASHAGVSNLGGPAGAMLADVLYYLFGLLALVLPVLLVYAGVWLYRAAGDGIHISGQGISYRAAGVLFTVFGGCSLATLHVLAIERLPTGAGGIAGQIVGRAMEGQFSFAGATLFALVLMLTGVTWVTGLSWLWLSVVVGRAVFNCVGRARALLRSRLDRVEGERARLTRHKAAIRRADREADREPVRIEPVIEAPPPSKRVVKEQQFEMFPPPEGSFRLPSLSLLDDRAERPHTVSRETLAALSRQLEMKLDEFGIEVQVVAVHPGPVITRFEVEPAPGVKVAQISNLAKDLARALSVISVRVVEVIPGKSTVGLEIPNPEREMIRLSETLRSEAYDASASALTLGLGKDIQGQAVVIDITKMPHLLVCGTTGSGKSVAINAMILSLLYKSTPDQVRLIMIDPKMLELSVYEGIPHLLAPVVTDMNEACNALAWCVGEMERRYKLMAKLGVRGISGYNRKVREAEQAGEPIVDPTAPKPEPLFVDEEVDEDAEPVYCQPMPYIVVVVDELADMMMLVGKKVETLIARLTQKARAAGVHLVLATQRPSVDVITGLIKANIPSRIAFQVSSSIDSRTILSTNGAENLLGMGDMLFMPPGSPRLTRVHGAFVSEDEIRQVVEFIGNQAEPDYLDESILVPEDERGGDSDSDGDTDPMYEEAIRVVGRDGRASTSHLQRRLSLGYNRAARIIDQLERDGLVGPGRGAKPREVDRAAINELIARWDQT